jgi:hypothetical protein
MASKAGNEEEFVRRWSGELAEHFRSLPRPPGPGTLIRSIEDPQLFYSFGPWRSQEAVEEMRANRQTSAVLERLISLCDEAKPGTFELVATAGGGEGMDADVGRYP